MRKAVTLVVAGAATAAITIGGAVSADAKSSPSKKLNKTDIAYLQAGHEVNLLEIRLGTFVVNHAKDQSAVDLARETRRDHKVADGKVLALSKKLNLHQRNTLTKDLKGVRNYVQKSKRLNRNYFIAQVDGHTASVAATKYEIKHGHDHKAKVYAKWYLPIAQAHLRMAKSDLAAYNKAHSGGSQKS